jgi:hypothetical protein
MLKLGASHSDDLSMAEFMVDGSGIFGQTPKLFDCHH